jgi:transposase InsO family protein
VKTISATLDVARSNIIERRDGSRARRGPQERAGDIELAGAIRALVDARPTYGYRRIAALLKRERRSDGLAPVNAKRVYRLMKKHGLLLERHTGAGARARRPGRDDPLRGGRGGETRVIQDQRHRVANVFIVVDNENSCHLDCQELPWCPLRTCMMGVTATAATPV